MEVNVYVRWWNNVSHRELSFVPYLISFGVTLPLRFKTCRLEHAKSCSRRRERTFRAVAELITELRTVLHKLRESRLCPAYTRRWKRKINHVPDNAWGEINDNRDVPEGGTIILAPSFVYTRRSLSLSLFLPTFISFILLSRRTFRLSLLAINSLICRKTFAFAI